MKIKGLLIFLIVVLIVFFIYLSNIDKKIYYLILGDYLVSNEENNYSNLIKKEFEDKRKLEVMVTGFQEDNARITDLIMMINDNVETKISGKQKTIKNALIKADFVLISIGSNDIFYELERKPEIDDELYEKIEEILNDYEKMLELIKNYCKEDIFITGLFNPYDSEYDEIIFHINKEIKNMSKVYDIEYVEITSCLTRENNNNNTNMTTSENKCVYNYLRKDIQNALFKNRVAD